MIVATPFVTLNGIRYRRRPDIRCTESCMYEDGWKHPGGHGAHLLALPRVPDWPDQLGPAPQYLSDSPETVLYPGDFILAYSRNASLLFFETIQVKTDIADMIDYLSCSCDYDDHGSFHCNMEGPKVYLICRADPEADV